MRPTTPSESLRDAVDRTATTAEEIHKAVADLPLRVLERAGLFDDTVAAARRFQTDAIGAVYDVVRQVNQRVGELADDLLDETDDAGPRAY